MRGTANVVCNNYKYSHWRAMIISGSTKNKMQNMPPCLQVLALFLFCFFVCETAGSRSYEKNCCGSSLYNLSGFQKIKFSMKSWIGLSSCCMCKDSMGVSITMIRAWGGRGLQFKTCPQEQSLQIARDPLHKIMTPLLSKICWTVLCDWWLTIY